MSKIYIRRGMLLLAGALALVGTVLAVRREKALKRSTPVAATEQPAASSGDGGSAVIRFVKNPEMAPPFEARDISGKVVSGAGWGGKVVLLNFWATWCPPCREEIPELITLQKQYKDRLEVIGLSEDDDAPEKVLKFAQQEGINYPIVMATPQLIGAYGGVPALPTSFLIDTQGRVVLKHSGLYPLEGYVREIRALLGLPVEARIETFVDTGQVFLKNAANATELPGVDFTGLTAEQKKIALHRLNAEGCTCGCGLTLSQCRVNDTTCPISSELAAQIVKEVNHGGKPGRAPARRTVTSD
ncbi:MAG: TlpA family protein disulfide reductase [Acidobacteriia bacterium]|nr:TlpA family protein disulfide reductase [Terriglobia bacterium]